MQNPTKFLFNSVFAQKGKSLLGYVFKASGHACTQLTQVFDNYVTWKG